MSNIIYLDDYRKFIPEDEPELQDPIVIGWDKDDSLFIASSVDTDKCLWMIDLAKKIIESSPPNIKNNDRISISADIFIVSKNSENFKKHRFRYKTTAQQCSILFVAILAQWADARASASELATSPRSRGTIAANPRPNPRSAGT